jgi:hypothetical protein
MNISPLFGKKTVIKKTIPHTVIFLSMQAFCDDLLAKASVHVAAVQAKMAAITGRAQQKKDQ